MSDALQNVGRLFLSPAPGSATRLEVSPVRAADRSWPRAALLGVAPIVPPLAAALAGELRAHARSGCALMLLWRDHIGARRRGGPAVPAASRLADRLNRRDLEAVAVGRLVLLGLPDDPRDALTAAHRAWAACDAPSVVALAGARPAAFDDLLRDVSLIVVADEGGDDRLSRLAYDGLRDMPGPVVTVPPLPGGPPRWLAEAGIGRLGCVSAHLGAEAAE